MRFLYLTTYYDSFLRQFYGDRPALSQQSYEAQRRALLTESFGWADFWSRALTPRGYEASELIVNAEPMQQAWGREHGIGGASARAIAIHQVREFAPDVIWFDAHDMQLLQALRDDVPSVRLLMGWTGSWVSPRVDWRRFDLVFSCAPEAVETLERGGIPARHIRHAFDPSVGESIGDQPKQVDVVFVGQVIPAPSFHGRRETLLRTLLDRGVDLTIHTLPAPRPSLRSKAERWLRGFKHHAVPYPWAGQGRFAEAMQPPLFGRAMYRKLRQARIALNIHADSSPRFASNMRLFETTGVGTCLVTDWRPNMGELFEDGREVVTYRNAQECAENIAWLLAHAEERERIAAAGQARCLRDHTFSVRAGELDHIVQEELRRRR
jgi:spore maturation protein CgeB